MLQQKTTQTQQQQQQMPQRLSQPRRRDIFLHFFKTLKLIFAVLRDRRVFAGRKLMFGVSVLACLVVLLFPDLLVEAGLSFLLPIVGTALGVPLDLGLDWTIFALAIVSLLRVFPADIVSEHYDRLFVPRRQARMLQQQKVH
jgi:hypothetical protein